MQTLPDVETAPRLRAVVGRLNRRLTAIARGSGLTPSQFSALGVITRRGPIRVSELAEIEGANPTMISRVVAVLEEQQLVRRSSTPDDRRVVLVETTAAGRRTHERLQQQRARALADALATLTPEQVDVIERALPALEALTAAATAPATQPTARQPVAR